MTDRYKESIQGARDCVERNKDGGVYLPDLLRVIDSQQAEIERLNKANTSVVEYLKKARRQLKTARAEAIKEFAKLVVDTLGMLNANELSGVPKEIDDIFYYQSPMAWTRGSTNARREAIALIVNTQREMVGEQE
jgi:hypothetical protein